MNKATRWGAGNPLALTARCRDGAIERGRRFEHQPSATCALSVKVTWIERATGLRHQTRADLNASTAQLCGTPPCDALIGVIDPVHDLGDASFNQTLSARRLTPDVTAWLKSHIRRRSHSA
jgi:hypothetical protein